MQIVIVILALLLWVSVPFTIAILILGPIDRAAKFQQAPIRIMMVDVMSLLFLLQAPFAVIHNLLAMESTELLVTLDLIVVIVVGLIWWTAVSRFSKAAINDARPRAILAFFVLPMAYVGSFAAFVIPMVLASHHESLGQIIVWGTIEAGLLAGLVVAGIYTRRLSAHATVERK